MSRPKYALNTTGVHARLCLWSVNMKYMRFTIDGDWRLTCTCLENYIHDIANRVGTTLPLHPYMDTRRSYRGTRTRFFAGSWIPAAR